MPGGIAEMDFEPDDICAENMNDGPVEEFLELFHNLPDLRCR